MENNKYDVCGFDKEDALNDLHKKDKLYDLFMEIISHLSNEEIEKLAKGLIEYVNNDKEW